MLLNQTDPDALSIEYQICAEYGREKDEKSLFLVQSYVQLFAVKGLVSPLLLRLYAKRAFAEYLRALYLETTNYKEGDESVDNHYIAKNFQDAIKDLTTEIMVVEKQALSMHSQLAPMTNVIPSVSPSGRFPASSPSLIGGPDAPRWFRR